MLRTGLWIGGSATCNNALVGLRPLAMTRERMRRGIVEEGYIKKKCPRGLIESCKLKLSDTDRAIKIFRSR